MPYFFLFLFLASLAAIVVGMVKPGVVIQWGAVRNRGRVLLTYGLAAFASLIFIGLTAENDTPRTQVVAAGGDVSTPVQRGATEAVEPVALPPAEVVSDPSPQQLDQPSEPTVDQAQSEQDDPAERVVNIGNEFKLGNFLYVVDKVNRTQQVGNEDSMIKRATRGASFVVVSFRITNKGNATDDMVFTDDFYLVDQRRRKFTSSTEGTFTLEMMSGGDFGLTQLQPDITKEAQTAFEVPNEVLDQGVTLVIPKKGFFGIRTVRIPLKF
jgi:hypothetical protein